MFNILPHLIKPLSIKNNDNNQKSLNEEILSQSNSINHDYSIIFEEVDNFELSIDHHNRNNSKHVDNINDP